jgi:hypothetical protein
MNYSHSGFPSLAQLRMLEVREYSHQAEKKRKEKKRKSEYVASGFIQ